MAAMKREPVQSAEELYVATHINARGRRTKAEMEHIRECIVDEVSANHPQTVRQVFYQMVVKGVVPKEDGPKGYGTVQRLLVELRMSREISFSWIADNTRWMRKPNTYSGLQHALRETAQFYRRDLWNDAEAYVEIWCEKDALAGVIMEETDPYDVPLMVARGFSSITYLFNSAQAIKERDKPAFIYHFGDHDPSGRWAARTIEAKLREFAPDAEIYFEAAAVTPKQIAKWNLPTRPTKREGNKHALGFEGDSVELDAIPATQLREIVCNCIEQHIDEARLAKLRVAEASEREFLDSLAKSLRQKQ